MPRPGVPPRLQRSAKRLPASDAKASGSLSFWIAIRRAISAILHKRAASNGSKLACDRSNNFDPGLAIGRRCEMSDREVDCPDDMRPDGLPTRRAVVIGATVVPMVGFPGGVMAQSNPSATSSVAVRLNVNGRAQALTLDPRSSLLDVLRETIGLTGAKKGCDHGQCGACTVHIDGRRVVSCLTMAVQASGREVTTIEGLAPADGGLHPMQQAFIDHDALQCGYCTPGQIMAAVACVREGHATTPQRIREYMSGNICRCGAYVGIVAAIQEVAPKMRGA
jgi:xanthine dehydrogenase YagT iron-sulfur-binding subunit